MTDRDSFIAAIAANPADDLPRLVFADWLDENGEPERAAFIRAQVQRSAEFCGPNDSALARTAADAFGTHGERWCRTLLESLSPEFADGRLKPLTSMWREIGSSTFHVLVMDRSSRTPYLVPNLVFQRGFVHELELNAANAPKSCSFAEAFRHEPIHTLNVHFGNASDAKSWPKLTEPALRRITRLQVSFHLGELVPRIALPPLFDDPHLAGVRQFHLSSLSSGVSDVLIPPAALAAFTRSPLAYRLDTLELRTIDDDGVRALCNRCRLEVSKLSLAGTFTRLAPPLLERAGLADTVSSLTLHAGAEFGTDGIAALAEGNWRKLTDLHLNCVIDDGGTFPPGGLFALAAAEFTPHLEVLDLSDNLLDDGSGNLDGLRELAAALNPGTLRYLNLHNTGLVGVPDFLGTQFGDRVVV
jgi:uncharacterized protein (TIGR02996 family)